MILHISCRLLHQGVQLGLESRYPLQWLEGGLAVLQLELGLTAHLQIHGPMQDIYHLDSKVNQRTYNLHGPANYIIVCWLTCDLMRAENWWTHSDLVA